MPNGTPTQEDSVNSTIQKENLIYRINKPKG